MLTVVKIGGAWLEAGGDATAFRALADLPGELVVVHGGGKEISRWLERAGVPVEWFEGLRVTRGDGLQLTAMVLSGWVNKRVVEAMDRAGRPAVGISGEDGRLLRAEPLDQDRLGEVGRVVAVDPGVIRALLAAGYSPVISPVSAGGDGGRPFNVNADEAAIHVARGVEANRLLLISDVPGVLAEGELLSEVDEAIAAELARRAVLLGGMRVKVEQALEVARTGVEVRIGDASLLTGAPGTRIVASSSPPARH